MNIGRRIFYELETGNIVLDTGEKSGDVVLTTKDQDFESFITLAERTRESVGVMELEYGQYSEDFAIANGYRVSIIDEIPTLEFSYPDPNVPEAPPVYQKPLSEQIIVQEQRLSDIELALADLFTGGV